MVSISEEIRKSVTCYLSPEELTTSGLNLSR
jgi:hypothetical protein